MSDLFARKIKTAEAAIKREIAMRRAVYPKRIQIKRMTQAEADQHIQDMIDALDVIQYVKETTEPTLFNMEGTKNEGH